MIKTGMYFLAFTIISLLFQSIKHFKKRWYFRKNGLLTTGKVESVVKIDNDDGHALKLKIIFKTIENQLIRKEIIKTERYYCEGLEVNILYDKNNPNNFLVNDTKANEELEAGIYMLLLVIVWSIGLYSMIYHPEYFNND